MAVSNTAVLFTVASVSRFDSRNTSSARVIPFLSTQNTHRQWTVGQQPAEAVWVVNHRHSDVRKI